MEFIEQYLDDVAGVANQVNRQEIRKIIDGLIDLRERQGRLFILGVGGGAGNASHAVNDFRKIAAIDAYAPTDNVSELTARVNDEGWETTFINWLKVSHLGSKDGIFVFSVGGGSLEKQVSPNIVRALDYAREIGAAIFGVVGRDGGHTAKVADACVVVPTVNPATVTPHTEDFQEVVWHLIVSHPDVQVNPMKWESTGSTTLTDTPA